MGTETVHICRVEPRFNDLPRDWGNLFIVSRVCYIQNLVITSLWKITKVFVISGYSLPWVPAVFSWQGFVTLSCYRIEGFS